MEVEFALKSKTNPIGVAEYRLQDDLPAEFKGKLPTAQQLANAVRDGLQKGGFCGDWRGRSGIRRITVGAWRPVEAGAMQVVSGPIGREIVHFEAPEAKKVEGEMTAFLEWLNTDGNVDPVLKAGIAHFYFVTTHPFEDGNGRIGRVIAELMLALADGTSERFYSMSAQIEAERKEYYLRLESGQRGGLDITSWIEWFLQCLGRAIERAEDALSGVLRKARLWDRLNHEPVNERQRKILNRLTDGFEGNLTTSKYAKIAKCSEDTALRDIQTLIKQGILAQNEGGGRSTSYSLIAEELTR